MGQSKFRGMFRRGQGGERDPPQAISWFQKAAAQGMEQARTALSKALPAAPATDRPASQPKVDEIPKGRPTQSGSQNETMTNEPSNIESGPERPSSHTELREIEQKELIEPSVVTPLPARQNDDAAGAPEANIDGGGSRAFSEFLEGIRRTILDLQRTPNVSKSDLASDKLT